VWYKCAHANRYDEFRTHLHDIRTRLAAGVENLALSDLIDELNSRTATPFETWEIDVAIDKMQDANHLMLADEMVYFIG
jgi:hypothetical protein